MNSLPSLPITEVLPQILSALDKDSNLVLVAPPGAGKTTLVPLALLDAEWRNGKRILVLEPRRLAARSAANRMAFLLGEKVGEQVGYRVRFDTKVTKHTIIEVITEGVFTRMLSDDPGLEDVAAVLFDEFHERSLDGDLALALCLDLQAGLREDLRLLPMSATLDGAGVAKLMDAPIVQSEGRGFSIEITHQDRLPNEKIEMVMARVVREEIANGIGGSILAFLPGQREIERTYDRLEGHLPPDVELHRLYGALSSKAQDDAIRPTNGESRKVVLASAIAETSLTIEGVNTVVDSGLSRQPVFEPATGLTRLQTVRASQASVTQRAGRAGRLGPGKAVRLWRAEQTAALPPHSTPEILNADLSALLLDLADWGVRDLTQLKWLDCPPMPALAEAENLLEKMAAMEGGMITSHGKAMRRIGLPPRFSHMVLKAANHSNASVKRATLLSLLVQERGAGGHSSDLAERCEKAVIARDKRTQNIVRLADGIAKKLGAIKSNKDALPHGVLLGLAFPDRIAQNRGQAPDGSMRYRLANGRGAQMEATEVLAREDFLVVVDMAGRAGAARIMSAAALTKPELLENFSNQISQEREAKFDYKTGRLSATSATRLGALVLTKPSKVAVDSEVALKALLQAVQDHGLDLLPWREEDQKLRGQLQLLHQFIGAPWPDVGIKALLTSLDVWLAPFLSGEQSLSSLGGGALTDGLMLLAGHPSRQQINALTPSHFDTPSGSRLPVEYGDGKVILRVRPQELFGLDVHPTIMDGRLVLDIELLSPANRAIQITRDLPGFWRGTWADVRSDMRGRYPKHPWPEDPLSATPTQRVKPRKAKK
ncbi:MAG: ATP-dependent helicase HrpB [Rhizobiaceae bacterium]